MRSPLGVSNKYDTYRAPFAANVPDSTFSLTALKVYMQRPVILYFGIGLFCTYLYFIFSPFKLLTEYLDRFHNGMTQPEWSSIYSGYLQRATPFPDPHSYLAVLRNAPAEPDGFSLAIFSDRVAVDMKGNIYTLTEHDYDGVLQLAQAITSLPDTGGFRNQWRVLHRATCRPIDRILQFVETSVYGFDKHHVLLEEPVNGYSDLPPVLWELNGLALEARDVPGQKDEDVLGR
ncbi:hypothetical protein BDZ97DRAFT_1838724, partial [Flammula alnicola]